MRSGIVNLRLAAAFVLAILLSAGAAGAVSLGKMTVLSPLGSRFEAEVQLLDARADKEPLAECFHLDQKGETDIPMLTRGRLTVVQQAAGLRLHIVSEQTIHEPLLQVRLRMGCGSEMVRNYLLLIDPPPGKTLPRPLAHLALGGRSVESSAPDPRPVSETRAIVPDTGQAPPAHSSTAAPTAVLRAGAARPLAPKTGPAGSASDRLQLSAGAESDQQHPIWGELPLRLSTRLSTHLLNTTSDSRRSILRIEYKLLSALRTQAEQQLSVARQVRQLAATLGELQNKAGGQARQMGSSAAPVAGATAIEQRRTSAEGTPATEQSDWWLEAGLLLGLIGGLSVWLRRRSGKQARRQEIALSAEQAIDSGQDTGWNLQPLRHDDTPTIVSRSEPTASALRFSDAASESTVFARRGENSEVDAVLELTEIMVSFGRIQGAEQALEEFIEQQPTAAVTPWLKLLEIHQQSGQREAFEALALKLSQRFNVAPPDWDADDVGEAGAAIVSARDDPAASIDQILTHLPAIGKLPHICSELSRTWNSPECLAYLNTLLRDNRNGERKGFAIGSVRELLFLIDLQESHRRRVH
jgi:pilus assembly protein FimV